MMEKVGIENGGASTDRAGCLDAGGRDVGDREPKPVAGKTYDLEDRTYEFARSVRAFIKRLPRTLANFEDARQLINCSGSVGANYIEANEALSKRDFAVRAKICRKEAKESRYWLRLVYTNDKPELDREREALVQEAGELTNIFGAIVRKATT